jgi:signal transduction histidine kinase
MRPRSRRRIFQLARAYRTDLAWVLFVGLNLLAMQLIPAWQTVPFLIIWITLTAAYGVRLWRLGSALVTVLIVTLATGGLIGFQVLRGEQDLDYLAEVPLLAMLFVVMVWHSRRRLAALEEMKRVSDHNVLLLDQQRQFLQDASHELGTPIAIALGHAELIENAATDQSIVADARIAVGELMRMRRLTSRLLLLASAEDPASWRKKVVDVEEIVVEAFRRWSHIPRDWVLGELDETWISGDADRLTMALDALIENAVDHSEPGSRIELAARRDHESVVISVTDEGSGIPAAEVDRIFSRFARVDPGRSRATGGFGLGLAIVKAIVSAHGGTATVRSAVGLGSVFELRLPAAMALVGATEPAADRPLTEP